MAYRVELTARATRDLRHIYLRIHADDSEHAFRWFNGLEAMVCSLEVHPARGAITPESRKLRHLLYGNKPNVYRIIYPLDERRKTVKVLHIRYGPRDAFTREPM